MDDKIESIISQDAGMAFSRLDELDAMTPAQHLDLFIHDTVKYWIERAKNAN